MNDEGRQRLLDAILDPAAQNKVIVGGRGHQSSRQPLRYQPCTQIALMVVWAHGAAGGRSFRELGGACRSGDNRPPGAGRSAGGPPSSDSAVRFPS